MIFLFFAVLLCGKPLAFADVSGFFFSLLAPRGMGGNAAVFLLLSVLFAMVIVFVEQLSC